MGLPVGDSGNSLFHERMAHFSGNCSYRTGCFCFIMFVSSIYLRVGDVAMLACGRDYWYTVVLTAASSLMDLAIGLSCCSGLRVFSE